MGLGFVGEFAEGAWALRCAETFGFRAAGFKRFRVQGSGFRTTPRPLKVSCGLWASEPPPKLSTRGMVVLLTSVAMPDHHVFAMFDTLEPGWEQGATLHPYN